MCKFTWGEPGGFHVGPTRKILDSTRAQLMGAMRSCPHGPNIEVI